jgi:hypothetical protein
MKTKRLTLESFKSVVKKIIKEELYNNTSQMNLINDRDINKKKELSNKIISYNGGNKTKLTTEINRKKINGKVLTSIAVKADKEQFAFSYDSFKNQYKFWKLAMPINVSFMNYMDDEESFDTFIETIRDALSSVQVSDEPIFNKYSQVKDFCLSEGQDKLIF